MTTRIQGRSDDLVTFDGDVDGEVGCFGTDREGHPGILLTCSDGTVLVAKYGKNDDGIWGITVRRQGDLFERIDECVEETEAGYSDVVHFRDGLKWVLSATEWEKVR